jgi:hypothetical protein
MKSKKKKINIKRCIMVFFIILALIIIIANIGKNNENQELSILLNNELIETLKNVIIDENSNIYFSKEDIQTIFDETIYYNEAEKELITTYNSHIALLKIDEDYALINDEQSELKGKLQEVDNTIYLPITDLAEVYDIEVEYSQKSNRIIIDSTQDKKVEASIIKRTKVKRRKGLFSKKIENLIIGDKVVILEDNGKYKKVRTSAGNIGYVKSKKLSDETVVREEVKEDKKELNVYSNYSNISGVYDDFEVDESKLNVVIPTFFYVDKNSKVLDKTTSTTATYAVYKNWTDTNKLEILPILTNNENVSNSLLSYSQRSQVATSLVSLLKEHNYIGINIKFDTIDDINSFYRFIIELTPRLKAAGLKTVVTMEKNIDKKRIENIVDYIIEE